MRYIIKTDGSFFNVIDTENESKVIGASNKYNTAVALQTFLEENQTAQIYIDGEQICG